MMKDLKEIAKPPTSLRKEVKKKLDKLNDEKKQVVKEMHNKPSDGAKRKESAKKSVVKEIYSKPSIDAKEKESVQKVKDQLEITKKNIAKAVERAKEKVKAKIDADFPKDSPDVKTEKKDIAMDVKSLKKALDKKTELKAKQKVLKLKIDALKKVHGSGAKVERLAQELANVKEERDDQSAKANELKKGVK